jgi:hypothetical protein
MFIMVERSVVLVTSDNPADEGKAKTIWTYDRETPAQAVEARPFPEETRDTCPVARKEQGRSDEGLQRIVGEWKKQFEDIYAADLTHEL